MSVPIRDSAAHGWGLEFLGWSVGSQSDSPATSWYIVFDMEHGMNCDTERLAFKSVLAFSLTRYLETVQSLSWSFIAI